MQAADNQLLSLSRLVAFSDSVFAFASTLLVIIFPFQIQALPTRPLRIYQNSYTERDLLPGTC
jgi:hypothetical protein